MYNWQAEALVKAEPANPHPHVTGQCREAISIFSTYLLIRCPCCGQRLFQLVPLDKTPPGILNREVFYNFTGNEHYGKNCMGFEHILPNHKLSLFHLFSPRCVCGPLTHNERPPRTHFVTSDCVRSIFSILGCGFGFDFHNLGEGHSLAAFPDNHTWQTSGNKERNPEDPRPFLQRLQSRPIKWCTLLFWASNVRFY